MYAALKVSKKAKKSATQGKTAIFVSEKIHWNKKAVALWIAEIAVVCALAFILVFYFGQRVSNAGDSMRSELKNGDVVLVNRLVYNAMTPKRGDIIAFKPNGRENAHYYIKRIVGLPGETVTIRDGKVYINDSTEPLRDDFCPETPVGDFGPYEVPEGCYFMLGDNRNVSKDSRYWLNPYVEKDKIIGKAFLRYWPLNKISLIE